MSNNLISQVRPSSTFNSFEKYDPEQEKFVQVVKRLADQIVAKADAICTQPYPFEHARLLIFWGEPGVGKTHLIEALVNHVKQAAPQVLAKMYLARENFTHANLSSTGSYGNAPIVIIDDLFAESHGLDQLHDATDIRCFMEFIKKMYEERRLIIITTNFAFKEGIVERVKKVDKVGRIVSRLNEILSRSGEFEFSGEDYRDRLAKANLASAEAEFVL